MIVCPKCGQSSNSNGEFCPHCGFRFSGPSGGNSQQPPKQNQPLIIVAVVLGVAVVALAAILLLMPTANTGSGGQPTQLVSPVETTTTDSDDGDVAKVETTTNTVVETPVAEVEQPEPEGQVIEMDGYRFIMPPEWTNRVVVEDRQQGNSVFTEIDTNEGTMICLLYPATQDNGADWNPDFGYVETHTCDNGNVVEAATGNDGCHLGYVTDGSGHACYMSIWQAIAWGNSADEQSKAAIARELEAAAAGLSVDAGDQEIALRCLEACAGRIYFD